MARYVRAFTLDASTIAALDSLLQEGPTGPHVEALLGQRPLSLTVEAPTLDRSDLGTADYEELYSLLPAAGPRPLVDWMAKFATPTRQPVWASLLATMQELQHLPDYAAFHTAVFTRAHEMKKINPRAQPHAPTLQRRQQPVAATTVNLSRCADALLILGLAALKERVAQPTSKAAQQGPARKARPGRPGLPPANPKPKEASDAVRSTSKDAPKGKDKLFKPHRRSAVKVPAVYRRQQHPGNPAPLGWLQDTLLYAGR